MSKEIQEFIEKLKDWKKNFPIQDYDYTKYDCEVADIMKYSMNSIPKLVEYIIALQEKIYDKREFIISHPFYNNIKLRSIKNFTFCLEKDEGDFANFLFLIDQNNQYPLIIVQLHNFCDFIISDGIIKPKNSHGDINIIGSIHKLISKYPVAELKYQYNKTFFHFNQCRPMHYFNEHLYFPYMFFKKHNSFQYIYTGKEFFVPKNFQKFANNINCVLIRPTSVIDYKKDFVYLKVAHESLSDYFILVDKDPLREDKANNNKIIQTLQTNNQDEQDKINNQEQLNNKQPYDLIIWLGLPGERRAWLEQIDGTANILKHLNKYFNKIKVYIDGMTAYDGERKEYPENKALFLKVLNATKELLQKEYNNASINTNSYNDIYGINSKDYCGARYTLNSDICILDFDELKELKLQSQENTYDNHANALEKLNEIKSKEKLIVFKSLAGYDYRTKICYCNDCDIVISDSGATALVPFEFHKKPGVIFYGDLSAYWINMSKNYASNAYQRVIDEKLVKQIDRKSLIAWSYHIPPQHIYNLAAEVLEELSVVGKLKIKNLKMHRLDVPPVELIAKQYELEQTLKIKLPIESVALYGELEKQINTLVLHNNTTLNQALENINTNNALSSTLQHSLQTKDQTIQNLENKIKDIEFKLYFKTAKARIQNHLAYKLGSALIENSKSIFGYIRMPYVLSYIRDKHRLEQKRYEENIKRYPELTLPPLESYPDYKEALKEKECFTYKLGEALIRADKEWYKGGYIKLWFEIRKLKKEFGKK
ncbi:TPA: hypothetical protein ACH5NL_000468 [Campylobacter coli]